MSSNVPWTLLISRCSLSTKLKGTAALCQSSPSQVLPTPPRVKCEYFYSFSITGRSLNTWKHDVLYLSSGTRMVNQWNPPTMMLWLNWPQSVPCAMTPRWTSTRSAPFLLLILCVLVQFSVLGENDYIWLPVLLLPFCTFGFKWNNLFMYAYRLYMKDRCSFQGWKIHQILISAVIFSIPQLNEHNRVVLVMCATPTERKPKSSATQIIAWWHTRMSQSQLFRWY